MHFLAYPAKNRYVIKNVQSSCWTGLKLLIPGVDSEQNACSIIGQGRNMISSRASANFERPKVHSTPPASKVCLKRQSFRLASLRFAYLPV